MSTYAYMNACTCARLHDQKQLNRGKGEPITRYEIQRLVLDQHHPDWDKGRDSIATGSGESLTTTTTTTGGSGGSNSDDENASTADPTTATTVTATTATGSDSSSSFKTPREGGDPDKADADQAAGSGTSGEKSGSAAASQEGGAPFPSVLGGKSGSGSGSGQGMGEDRKQVGVWIGQRTDKMAPYHTAAGLPTYCRCGSGHNEAKTRSRYWGIPTEQGGEIRR